MDASHLQTTRLHHINAHTNQIRSKRRIAIINQRGSSRAKCEERRLQTYRLGDKNYKSSPKRKRICDALRSRFAVVGCCCEEEKQGGKNTESIFAYRRKVDPIPSLCFGCVWFRRQWCHRHRVVGFIDQRDGL